MERGRLQHLSCADGMRVADGEEPGGGIAGPAFGREIDRGRSTSAHSDHPSCARPPAGRPVPPPPPPPLHPPFPPYTPPPPTGHSPAMATPHVIASSNPHAHSSSSSSNGVVGTHYRVGKKIGEGSFGVVFEGARVIRTAGSVAAYARPPQARTCSRTSPWRSSLCVYPRCARTSL
jgi:hypothetical protein